MFEIGEVVIAGAGPVGSFTAVLTSLLGLPVVVYEKREVFTREINVKITPGFFEQVQSCIRLLGIEDEFFHDFNERLAQKKNRIVIKEFESLFKQKAISLGAKYVLKEVNSFEELYAEHGSNQPIIIDCTGRKSKLRTTQFGQDDANMEVIPLESAMHINFRASFKNIDQTVLYSAMKNNEDIKLAEIVASKAKKVDLSEMKNVTIPIFISKSLADRFDEAYPDINRAPMMPFANEREIPYEIFEVISSILGPLLMEDWQIDFKSIQVKKIEITCGYAFKRSCLRYICLGDSAVHLAFYKSLNFGLKHALDFFLVLSGFSRLKSENIRTKSPNDSLVLDEFRKKHPSLNAISVRQTADRNTFLIVTKVIFYGVYKFCLANSETEQLTSNFGVRENEIDEILSSLNEKLNDWSYLMRNFEEHRAKDIRQVIESNCRKKKMFDFVSDFVWLNGKSPIKLSELLQTIQKGYSLFSSDLQFINECLLIVRVFPFEFETSGKGPRRSIEQTNCISLGHVRKFIF